MITLQNQLKIMKLTQVLVFLSFIFVSGYSLSEVNDQEKQNGQNIGFLNYVSNTGQGI